jgi:LacI family transcriptional regulator
MAYKTKRNREWPERQRVALVIETSTNYGRRLLSGIVRFRQTNRNWSVFLEQRDLSAAIPPWLSTWRGDGIISRATTHDLAQAVALTGVPLVDLTDRREDLGFTYIWSDDAAIGVAGAKHFIERGFLNFAFCGFSDEAWSTRREIAFCQTLQGGEYKICDPFSATWFGSEAEEWETQQSQLVEWLLSLPKPIGIMACNDVRGQHVIDACSKAHLLVPENVAVLGVDDDELLCKLCDPSLSSIVPDAEQIGFLSAQLLADEMAGQKSENRGHLISPLGVTERQSTDTYAVEDPDVAKALSFIRARACSGIGVEDVSRHVGVSRSTLERKIRKYSQFSPQVHIRNKQIQHVQDLLVNTELTTEQIAINCGFEHPEYLHVVFRRELGMTPGEYRRAAQH